MKKVKRKNTIQDLLDKCIKEFKADNKDWKKLSQSDLYGIESYIDGWLYEKEYNHLAPGYGSDHEDDNHEREDDYIVLERFTFAAIKILQNGRRHTCDPYYDTAFNGYDEL